MQQNWKTWLAAGGGVGFLPFATGTWGALVALFPLLPYYGSSDFTTHCSLLILAVAGLWLGVRIADDLEPAWGKDPKAFVWDEFIGMWITLIGHAWHWKSLLLGFLLFRFFDIFKPLGIRRLERIRGGWGVMLDDVAAGLAANLCLFGVEQWIEL